MSDGQAYFPGILFILMGKRIIHLILNEVFNM